MGLQAHPVVDELSRIAPELLIKGGSFSEWLPHPHDVPPGSAHGLLLATQRRATRECLIDLLATAGLPAIEPERLASGARAWPSGYIGSVSHKGTTVAAAITGTDRMASIGIDIDRLDGRGVPQLCGLDGPEHPPSFSEAAGRESSSPSRRPRKKPSILCIVVGSTSRMSPCPGCRQVRLIWLASPVRAAPYSKSAAPLSCPRGSCPRLCGRSERPRPRASRAGQHGRQVRSENVGLSNIFCVRI